MSEDAATDWPNQSNWAALQTGVVDDGEVRAELFIFDCGVLHVPSGKLVACDPFAWMRRGDNAYVRVPPGSYHVRVTIADLSPAFDRSHVREAYATLILHDAPEVIRRALPLTDDDAPPPVLGPGEYVGFPVDAGTACFVDDEAVRKGMPAELQSWLKDLFENEKPDSWFNLMDSPTHLREGLANIPLPEAVDGTNLILFHSGWGDGVFPVVGGYDAAGELVRVHIDFAVIR